MRSFNSPDAHKLVFGAQIMNFDRSLAGELRSTMLDDPSLEWIVDVFQNLPLQWHIISETIPQLKTYPGIERLNDATMWIRTGVFDQFAFPLVNLLQMPLAVATHLAQYVKFMELICPDDGQWDRAHASIKQKCEIVGFCTGKLSAAAVTQSANWTEFCQLGAAAIHAAMAIGALGDSLDSDQWVSFVVGYTESVKDKISTTLAQFPEAYMSVVPDEGKMTLTARGIDAPLIKDQLRGMGMSVTDIGLRGAFHYPPHTPEIEPLLKVLTHEYSFKLPIADGEALGCTIARYMITETSNWLEQLARSSWKQGSLAIAFGPPGTIPPSLASNLGPHLLWRVSGFQLAVDSAPAPVQRFILATRRTQYLSSDESIAVVGMALKTAGAADVDEFWDLLCKGPSQHVLVTPERRDHQNEWQENEFDRTYFASFISDADCFDHKFFRKSPRECASMDPQHRLMLETSYQALESAGYFSEPAEKREPNVGCYVGIGVAEYERNVSTHPITAYAVTGNAMSFVAGKIGHQFGWTGPCLAINTACSSAGVSVDLACKAILSGECTAALAAGVNVLSRSEWFNFLGGGSFLSGTGQCKPFDQDADGYSRGEAVGAVYMKRLSAALEHGDNIIGVIAASRCFQNQNTTIVAPSQDSLSQLFQTVVAEAGLQPKQISFVEAHGTGTQVGDTAEFNAIKSVLGGERREEDLALSSVKGLVGHTETASGIISLIKALESLHYGALTPHYSFRNINPAFNASPLDRIKIQTHMAAWTAPRRAAVVNNYGASGANAAQVVIESPRTGSISAAGELTTMQKYPFWLSGLDEASIARYANRLLQFLQKGSGQFSFRNLSFQLSRQSNRSLDQALTFTCSSLPELKEKLRAVGSKGISQSRMTNVRSSSRPVVLCFGGQTSRTVGVDRAIYEGCTIFRKHLDACDRIFRQKMGIPSMYPAIFNEAAPGDTVTLQAWLFAVQYACAKAWIDSGVRVAAMIGHSFGELTAMCVSGVFSLQDMITLIARRAKIIEDSWSEPGNMLIVDADKSMVEMLVQQVRKDHHSIDIACFNGPRSFTISGSTLAIQAAETLATSEAVYSSVKVKRLDVTHAFHSPLVEQIMSKLSAVDADVIWREPSILLERSTREATSGMPTLGFIAEHLRNPVCFSQATQRLHERLPESVWLEVGSNSGITTMAKHSLGAPQSCHFQPVNIGPNQTSKCLADVTLSLWEQGVNIYFWTHHPEEAAHEPFIPLPSYQFERSQHWMKAKIPLAERSITNQPVNEEPEGLWTFVGYEDAAKKHVRFRVNTRSKKCRDLIAAHVIADFPIWSSALQMLVAVEAIQSLIKTQVHSELRPQVQRLVNHCALCIDDTLDVFLYGIRLGDDGLNWKWNMSSVDKKTSTTTLYVSADLSFRRWDDVEFQMTIGSWERWVDRQRIRALLDEHEAEAAIQGRHNIYKAFAPYVDYKDDRYKALQIIAGKGDESAGRVKADGLETFMDTLSLVEPVGQVAGMYLNSMTERDGDDMYIAHGIGHWVMTPEKIEKIPTRLEALARHRRSKKGSTSDVFAFDLDTGRLYMAILGIEYNRVARSVLYKKIRAIATGEEAKRRTAREEPKTAALEVNGPPSTKHKRFDSAVHIPNGLMAPEQHSARGHTEISSSEPGSRGSPGQARLDHAAQVADTVASTGTLRTLLSNLLGIDTDLIKTDSDLTDLGVDSLMVMELARDIEKSFEVSLEMRDLVEVTDLASLVDHVQTKLGATTGERSVAVEPGENENIINAYSEADGRNMVNGDERNVVNGVEKNIVNDYHEYDIVARGDHDPTPLAKQGLRSSSEPTTDFLIAENGLVDYLRQVQPKLQELCAAYIFDAFERLGSPIQYAKPDDRMERLSCLPARAQFLNALYEILEEERFILTDGSELIRTEKPLSMLSTDAMSRMVLDQYPQYTLDTELIRMIGPHLVPFLTGEVDGVKLTFGSTRGGQLLSQWYEKSPINAPYIAKMEHSLMRVVSQFEGSGKTMKILEIGGGTGATTRPLVRRLTDSGVSFQYTFTDLGSWFVSTAKNTFPDKQSMDFRVLDLENPPPDLDHEFDIILATNCVHATRNLKRSMGNIYNLLRPNGFVVLLELTTKIPWIDFVFGVFEGWWLFEDGRQHAVASKSLWKDVFDATGLSLLDQSSGELPETDIQTIFVAHNSKSEVHSAISSLSLHHLTDDIRRSDLMEVAASYAHGFLPPRAPSTPQPSSDDNWILLTGATGGLGAHLLEYYTGQKGITKVVCLNRYGKIEAEARQLASLEEKGILLSAKAAAKTKVLEADTSKPMLGLSGYDYAMLLKSTSFIVHNAWPMSMKRGIEEFEPQFRTMRNLIDFARECANRRSCRIGFQFVSSLAVQRYDTDVPPSTVPQAKSPKSFPPWGYGSAKFICETMLRQTLISFPEFFRATIVRVGQASGSKKSGWWNRREHLPVIIKSAQTLGAWPRFEGELSWVPIDDVATIMGELLLASSSDCRLYNVENPSRLDWREMNEWLAQALQIPLTSIIPLEDWISRVQLLSSGASLMSNPALQLVEHLKARFIPADCGQPVLDTLRSEAHSSTLRHLEPVNVELLTKYIKHWKDVGFLS